MNHIPFIVLLLATSLLVAADKKPMKPVPSAAQIQTWIKQLRDDEYKVRELATKNLIEAGEVAFGEVREAAKSNDAEVKNRAWRIIKHPETVAIAYVKNMGGTVTVDKKSPGEPVTEVNLDTLELHISASGEIELRGSSNFTDAGLVNLQGLSRLRVLTIRAINITDAGLVHLYGLTKLQVLKLHSTKVTQAGIDKLSKALPKCKITWSRVPYWFRRS